MIDPAKVLRDRMSETGLTQADLVRMTGIGRSTIARYLSGENTPAVTTWFQLLSALGLQADLSPSQEWSLAERVAEMSANAAELELQAVYPDRRRIVRDNFLAIAS
jgi:transcriptional regulator with XRE-family HTH domain